MQNKTHRKIFSLNLLVILIGGLFLGWFYILDGKITNKPIEWVRGVDPQNIQIAKPEYHVGETPVALYAFCKTRPAHAMIEWTLIDGQRVSYAEREGGGVPVGCYPNRDGYLAQPIEKIPLFIDRTCDAYFVGTIRYEISGGREVVEALKTEKFCVTPAEVLEKVEQEIIKQDN